MTKTDDCYIAIAGSAWRKAHSLEEAIRNILMETAYENARTLSVWHIRFAKPVDSLDCVEVDEIGSVTYPSGAELTKFERLPLPPALTSAAREFEGTLQDWLNHSPIGA